MMGRLAFTRRRVLGAGAMALLATGCATLAQPSASVTRRSLAIPLADGAADALLFTPAGAGPWPALVVYPDAAGGLRPLYEAIGTRLAEAGFVVLIPNQFYRAVRLDGTAATAAPVLPSSEAFARGQQWRATATDDAVMADARALFAFLDALPQVDRAARAGVIGYDVGAAHAFLAARSLPDRIGSVAAAHPGAIATARDNSPHLFVGQSRARYLIQIAAPDDAREPTDKDDLAAAFAAARLPASITVVPQGRFFALADQPDYDAGAGEAFLAAALANLRAGD